MKLFLNCVVFLTLIVQSSLSYSENSFNLMLLPDPYDCHQIGIEMSTTENSRLGVLGVANCDSDRPTYGESNDNVTNNFSRILFPWTYSKGAWNDGYFVKVLAGFEKSEFESTLGSTADVTFADISANVGYQWFWSNGLNISASLGLAYLYQNSVTKDIKVNEARDVVDFLDKNTKTNQHIGLGIILGWAF